MMKKYFFLDINILYIKIDLFDKTNNNPDGKNISKCIKKY